MDAKNKTLGDQLVSIVEDDYLMRRSTWRLLRAAGFRAEAFSSAEGFLMSGLVGDTACLILDLRMPGMNGLQLQQRLIESSNLIPIIFFSAHSSADEERQALQAGAVQFLQKPVNKDVLLFAIRNTLNPPANNERKIP